jgi:hypothetical protein
MLAVLVFDLLVVVASDSAVAQGFDWLVVLEFGLLVVFG